MYSLLMGGQRQHEMRSLPNTFTNYHQLNPRPFDLESNAVFHTITISPCIYIKTAFATHVSLLQRSCTYGNTQEENMLRDNHDVACTKKCSHSTKKASNHHANLPLEMYSFTL